MTAESTPSAAESAPVVPDVPDMPDATGPAPSTPDMPGATGPAPPAPGAAPDVPVMPGTATSAVPVAPPAPDAATTVALDDAIAAVRAGARVWSSLSLPQRATLLRRVRGSVAASAAEWATTAARSKGLDESHPLVGEEWLSGPYAVLGALDGYLRTLRALIDGRSPLDGVRIDDAPGHRVRAHVFPSVGIDRILLSGFTGEVWLRPGVTAAQARDAAGLGQRHPTDAAVGLVLGAGNITSIPVLDVLYELLSANRVSVLKVNPTQDALVPVLQRALGPLAEACLVRIVRGGGDVGAALTGSDAFAHVHVTGSAATFDAIVWGAGPHDGAPRLRTPITAELGGVSPIIVVPGRWTDADLRYQASHVATMRLHNSGHNCIAGQVVILSRDWPQRDAFLAALRDAYAAAPRRPVWYPRSAQRMDAASAAYPDAEWSADRTRALIEVGDGDAVPLQTTEYFAPVLGVVDVPGTGLTFLHNAVAHANDELAGTLGANVLIDPDTQAILGDGFERAIAELRYGGIAVNAWTGVLFATPALSWGAFPGGTPHDVGSGIGVVHNALLLDDVERSVLHGPFRPFPRSLGRHGTFSILPKPPWFTDSRTATPVAEGLTRWYTGHSIPGLARTLTRALRS